MKAGIYAVNTNTQAVAAGGLLGLTTIVRRYGNDNFCNPVVNLANNNVTLGAPGYYLVTVDVTDEPTAAGAVTATLYQDGAAVPGAVATNTAAAGSDATSVSITALVRVIGCATSTLTVALTAGEGNVTNYAVTAVKV